MIGLGILLFLILVAIFAPLLAPHDPFAQELGNRLQPLWADGHLLGTDSLGRDILSRLIYGSRITLYIVILVALIAPIAGLFVGTVAGYVGGWADTVLMRITDIFLAFPRLVLALAFVAALGAGIENAVIAIALTAWPPYARIARAETLTIRQSDLYQRREAPGRWATAHNHKAHLAALHLLADCTRDARHGWHHSCRSRSRLSRSGCPAPIAGMGCDDFRRPQIHSRPLVGRDHAGSGNFHGQSGLQSAWRWSARRARPKGRGEVINLLEVENLWVKFPTRSAACSMRCAASRFRWAKNGSALSGNPVPASR